MRGMEILWDICSWSSCWVENDPIFAYICTLKPGLVSRSYWTGVVERLLQDVTSVSHFSSLDWRHISADILGHHYYINSYTPWTCRFNFCEIPVGTSFCRFNSRKKQRMDVGLKRASKLMNIVYWSLFDPQHMEELQWLPLVILIEHFKIHEFHGFFREFLNSMLVFFSSIISPSPYPTWPREVAAEQNDEEVRARGHHSRESWGLVKIGVWTPSKRGYLEHQGGC